MPSQLRAMAAPWISQKYPKMRQFLIIKFAGTLQIIMDLGIHLF
jgi:hypothetical protein